MVPGGGSALTGRVGRNSTAGLAGVPAARLALAQLDEGVGRSHTQLGRERSVVGAPVGQQSPRAWFRPGFRTVLWHTVNSTTNPVPHSSEVPVSSWPGKAGRTRSGQEVTRFRNGGK